MTRLVLFSAVFVFLGATARAQTVTQYRGDDFGASIVDQFPMASGQQNADVILENLKTERLGADIGLPRYPVQSLDKDQLGELARAPGTGPVRAQIDYGYVYDQLQGSDQLGAALAAQAAGTDAWVGIVTDTLPSDLPTLAATRQTEDLAKALGLMSQVQLAELGDTPLTSVQLDLANTRTIWRVDGIDYTLPIESAPAGEVMRWIPAADIPGLLAAYEPDTPQAWSTILEQFNAIDKPYADVNWSDLRDRAIENGSYAQLDRLMETDPTVRGLLSFDYTPEARIRYLEARETDALGQVQLGRLYLDRDPALAATRFQSALEDNPDYLPAQVGLAQIALYPSADHIGSLPNRTDALSTLQMGQAAGIFDASFTLATSEGIIPPQQRIIASLAAQEQAVSPEDAAAARKAQSSNCRAAAETGDGTIKCQFFDIAYITNRAPISEGSVLLDFGTELVDETGVSVGILRNDLVIAQTIPADQPGLIGRVSCVGLGVCLPVEVLRPEASETGFEGVGVRYEGSLDDGVASAFDHFSTGYRNPDSALVFIHGFNTDFREAVDALTNLMITARYPSTPFLLSWPSEGRLWAKDIGEAKLRHSLALNYPHDRSMVTESCVTMHAALSAVVDRYGAGKVDLVVHSMGNELFYEMLTGCGAAQLSWPTEGGAPFRFLILSAPDVSVANFEAVIDAYTSHAEKTFIYGTDNDLVLQVSGYINRELGDHTTDYVNRLGFFSSPPAQSAQVNWINTITIDGVSQYAPLNHSHYINTAPVRRDIAMILNGYDHDGSERCIFPADNSGAFFYISPNCL